MGYSHIGIEERRRIARLRKAGTAIRQIAASLDRSPSARRWRWPRLDRDDLLREAVFHRLAWGASPEQAAGSLALEMGRPVISAETIYRFI